MDLLREEIENLIDFSLNKTIGETRGIKKLEIKDDIVNVEIYLGDLSCQEQFKGVLARLVKLNLGYKGIKCKFIPISKKDTIFDRQINFILIASGKGGVGKSNVTANIATSLTRLGKKVGIIDADIYGASIPNIFGLDENINARGNEDGKIIPYDINDIEMVSTDFFVDKDQPLMWRGPMLGKMLEHFFNDVLWGKDLEYLLIDLPPGTGDIAIDLGKIVPNGKMIVVTTPHKNAAPIATKAGLGAIEMKIDILGVIENMSFYSNPVNGNKEYIFGNGGGEIVAKKLDTSLLGQIPISQPKGFVFSKDEEVGIIYDNISEKIISILNN